MAGSVVQNLRITRAQLDARGGVGSIRPGQVYLISDEARIAIGLTTATYETYAKASENTAKASLSDTHNFQTGTAYTLVAADNGKVVDMANAAAITLTLPNSLSVGFNCIVRQSGVGQITRSLGGGATLRNRSAHTKTAGQWAELSLSVRTNVGGAAAEYVMSGDTA